MRRVLLSLALIALVVALTPKAEARTRVKVGFSYGSPYYCYSRTYAYPVVVHTYPRYRYKRLHRPYYYRTYFRNRPYARVIVRPCY